MLGERLEECFVVLGMHRSGTSALSGALNILGVDLGINLMPPDDCNPKGFFENSLIADFNDRLLDELASSWDDPVALPDGWENFCFAHNFSEELNDILAMEFSGQGPVGFKDPRLCVLMPWWKQYFQHQNAEPRYIIVIRHPLEVVESLQKRSQGSIGNPHRALLLWLKYMLEAEFHTRGQFRCFIFYDDLLADPIGSLKRISREVGTTYPLSVDHCSGEIRGFLDTGLRHHRREHEPLDTLGLPVVSNTYLALTQLASVKRTETPDASNTFDEYRRHYYDFCSWPRAQFENRACLYVDTGAGFNEKQKCVATYSTRGNVHEAAFDLRGFERIVRIRFDPLEEQIARIQLIDIDTDGFYNGVYSSNGACRDDNWYEFGTDDPCFVFQGDYSKATYMTVTYAVGIVGATQMTKALARTNEALTQTRHELEETRSELAAVYLSASWRLTKCLRRFYDFIHAVREAIHWS